MVSLVEFCKTMPGDILDTIDFWLKPLGNPLIIKFLSLKYHHRHDKIVQFWCADGYGSEEEKKELIEVEYM